MKKTFHIKGMHCKSCSALIKSELEDAGVKSEIDFSSRKAEVEFDDKKINIKKIKQIISKGGYSVK